MPGIIFICARGGSKGVPNKNIKLLNGKPLISYTINVARKFAAKHNFEIELSTDSELIKNVSSECGLPSEYLRPEHLASDGAGKNDVWKDLLRYSEEKYNKTFEFILDLDVSSPLRTLEDLDIAYINIKKNKEANNLFSVSKPDKNPYFNMVEQSKNSDYFELCKQKVNFISRQEAPTVYSMNASFYFMRRDYFTNNLTTINSKSLVYLMPHICFDIDESLDWEFMEFLLSTNRIKLT